MYEPFPGNHLCNLSVNLALAMGEIDQANGEVRSIAQQGEDEGTKAISASWGKQADRQCHGQGVNSPDRRPKIFKPRACGIEHVGTDNIGPVRSYIADRPTDRFARMAASA